MTIATLNESTLTIRAGAYASDIAARDISHNWGALSFYPERRAMMELGALADRLCSFGSYVAAISDQGGAIDAKAELERFARKHVALTLRAWRMDSRTASAFIVGPSKFPAARNNKRMGWADSAYGAIRDHAKAARAAVERAAWPHGSPGGPIRASNPDAPELIRAELDKLKASHAMMKAANAAIRASIKRGADDDAIAQAVVDATGFRFKTAALIASDKRDGHGRGFATFQLSNTTAEIKRLETRLSAIEANRARGTTETERHTTEGRLRIVEDPEAARVQLYFDGKPSAAARDVLKARGFRWAPSVGAWQRHLNNAGRFAADMVARSLAAQA